MNLVLYKIGNLSNTELSTGCGTFSATLAFSSIKLNYCRVIYKHIWEEPISKAHPGGTKMVEHDLINMNLNIINDGMPNISLRGLLNIFQYTTGSGNAYP
jgi:hypothetical protein